MLKLLRQYLEARIATAKAVACSDGLERRAVVLAAMLNSPWWMEYIRGEVVKGGNGSIPELAARLADDYTTELERRSNDKLCREQGGKDVNDR